MSFKDKVFYSVIAIFFVIQMAGFFVCERVNWTTYTTIVNFLLILVMGILCIIKNKTNIFND